MPLPPSKTSKLTFVFAAGIGLVFSGVVTALQAESSVGPVTPTGNFSVGRTCFHWVDSHRTDPVAAESRTKREFMVIVWYPAETNDSPVYAPWMPDRWASSEALFLYGQRVDAAKPLTIDQTQQAIRQSMSNSITEAPMAHGQRLWPVLLFAPGAGVNTAFYSTFTEDLASHGYVVFGIVPTGWVATVFPDGHKVPTSDKRSDDLGWITGTALPLWANDLHFMLDQVERLDRDSDGIFFHRLDLSRVGAFGHSFGGTASILAGLQDERIKAVLNLDGSPFGVLSKTVLPKPFMVIKHDISPKYAPAPPDEAGKAIQAKVEDELSSVYLKGRPGYRVAVAEAKHMTFSDMAVLQTWAEAGRRFVTEDANDGAMTLAVIRDYIRAFFDQFLLGRANPLLARPPGRYGICVLDSTTASEEQANNASSTDDSCVFDFERGETPNCIRQTPIGELFIASQFLKELDFDSYGLAPVLSPKDGWMYVSRRGMVIVQGVPATDNGPDSFHDGLVRIVRNTKYGFADRTGRILIPPTYDGAMNFEAGKAKVCNGCHSKCADHDCEHHVFAGGEWFQIDAKGTVVARIQPDN